MTGDSSLSEEEAGLANSPSLKRAQLARLESALLWGALGYLKREGFALVPPPEMTKGTGACENPDTLFEVSRFGQPAVLSQTGQLFLEGLVSDMSRVSCVTRSYRAEPVEDERHLTEFTLIELEFCGGFDELLDRLSDIILAMVKQALDEASDVIEAAGRDVAGLRLMSSPFQRLRYADAIRALGLKWGADLKSGDEQRLVQMNGNQPLFVTHFPRIIKFFNMLENRDDPRVVNSADLLLPFAGEAAGAAEREWRWERVQERFLESPMWERFQENGRSVDDFSAYLDRVRNEPMKPHAGGGIGLARVQQFILGQDDVRSSTPFPCTVSTIY